MGFQWVYCKGGHEGDERGRLGPNLNAHPPLHSPTLPQDVSAPVSLVVNVASACGFTDGHYRGLQQLQRDLGPRHFTVLAFPCNQFGQQEPDGDREIESFARRTYGVSFPMFSKVAVTGTGAHPAFKYLTQTSGKEPTWNFWKYLVAPDGKVVGAWDPTVSVEDIRPQITALVRKLILKKREDL
ncbi:glutathione peroxidase 7 isoform X4 [Vulpes vulpes]|uniref:Glutathione peroxidase n=1 Tax=Vulpes vulpes TaxID=9627 RepID=A0A3Q7RPX1_VULVU|nr:glutathione peroxidase 7 isoform X2 [Vulpes vulpes]XP_025847599.1 glutathione peroxidase 7 isoform X2 [Vulpes vulpes]